MSPSPRSGFQKKLRSGCEKNHPLIPASMLNRNLHIPLAAEALELFAPLDQQNAVRVHQVVDGQGVQLARSIDAVEVDVVERDIRSAVFVDERKRRAGDAIGLRGLEALGNSL